MSREGALQCLINKSSMTVLDLREKKRAILKREKWQIKPMINAMKNQINACQSFEKSNISTLCLAVIGFQRQSNLVLMSVAGVIYAVLNQSKALRKAISETYENS